MSDAGLTFVPADGGCEQILPLRLEQQLNDAGIPLSSEWLPPTITVRFVPDDLPAYQAWFDRVLSGVPNLPGPVGGRRTTREKRRAQRLARRAMRRAAQ